MLNVPVSRIAMAHRCAPASRARAPPDRCEDAVQILAERDAMAPSEAHGSSRAAPAEQEGGSRPIHRARRRRCRRSAAAHWPPREVSAPHIAKMPPSPHGEHGQRTGELVAMPAGERKMRNRWSSRSRRNGGPEANAALQRQRRGQGRWRHRASVAGAAGSASGRPLKCPCRRRFFKSQCPDLPPPLFWIAAALVVIGQS